MSDSGIKPRIPAYKREGNYEPPPPAVLNGAGKVEELPPEKGPQVPAAALDGRKCAASRVGRSPGPAAALGI